MNSAVENRPVYLKGLNGIRAIAAIGVLVSHTNMSLAEFNIKNYSIFGFGANGKQLSYILGAHGVTMFFVLSGFLITFLLLKEIKKTDTINIKAFYIRRILRIWPLYFLYLTICLIVLYYFHDKLPSLSTFFLYVFFLANVPFIGNFSNHLLAHLWSIAVEEQFYLFWPHLFKFKDKLFKIILGLIIIQGVFRVIVWILYPFSKLAILSNVNRFDCMMMGGLLAILIFNNSKYLKIITNKYIQFLAWIGMFALIFNVFNVINTIIEFSVVSVITCVIIAGQVLDTNKIINLENKVFNFFGVLSFGIYVYHPLIIYILEKILIHINIENELLKVSIIFLFVFSVSTLIAWLSYNFIEVKFLKLKDKFQIVKSTNKVV